MPGNLKRWFLALTLIAGSAIAPAAQARTASCPAPLLAMSYNIRLDTPADGANGWAFRRDWLIDQIVILRPALLGMQEVLPNQRADLEAALPGYAFIGEGRDGGTSGEASPIAIDRSLFRIGNSGTFWLSPTPELPSVGWDAAFPRIVSWAHLVRKADRAGVLVVNTHWDHVGIVARRESGRQMAEWIAANRLAGERVIVLGDFNTDLADPALAQLLAGHSLNAAAGNAEARGPEDSRPSFNGFDAMPGQGKTIDHILTSDDVLTIRHMVIAQHFGGRVASDHFPVVALLKLPPGKRGQACTP